METSWLSFRDAVYKAASETLGKPTRKHRDWFDENCEEIGKLLKEKHSLMRAHTSDPDSIPKHEAYKRMRNIVKDKLSAMEDE